jgi:hypothetical protein
MAGPLEQAYRWQRSYFESDLGQFFMEPGDFYDVLIGKVLHFIRSVGLTKG